MKSQTLPTTLKNISKTFTALKKGEVCVIPTDTLYGMVGVALNKFTVEKIYKLRQRNPEKPLIVLISSYGDLRKLKVVVSKQQLVVLKKIWPGPVSVILPCNSKKLEYLHRGTNTLALRMPANEDLRKNLKKSGPLVAPSANLENKKPAATVKEAKKYFKNGVSIYLDAGKVTSNHSTLAVLEGLAFRVLREGAGEIPAVYQWVKRD